MQSAAISAQTGPPDWVSRAKAVKSSEQALQVLYDGDFHGRWELVKRFPDFGHESIAPLLALAQDDAVDVEIRWFAIRSLGRFATSEAITGLAQIVLTTDDEDLGCLAAEQLAQLGSDAIAALVPLLDYPQERPLAVRALAQIRQPAVIAPLLTVMSDGQPTIRQMALEALGSFHDPRVTPVLLTALGDTHARVRKEAVITLGHRRDLLSREGTVGSPPDGTTQSLQNKLIQKLTQCLWDFDIDVCCQAAIALGRLGLNAAVPALARLLALDHTPEPLLMCVVRSLTWIDTVEAYAALTEAYGSLPVAIQTEIIRHLSTMQASPQAAVQFLSAQLVAATPDGLGDLPDGIKQAIAFSLGQLGDQTAFMALVPLLADPSRPVQFHVLQALDQLSTTALAEQLEALLNDNTLPISLKTQIETHLASW